MRDELYTLFWRARSERFKDGMISRFERELTVYIQSRADAVHEVIFYITDSPDNTDVCAEALRILGRLDHAASQLSRRLLLEHSLSLPQQKIRAAAALGLASIDDPASTPALERAVNRESISELKKDLQQVLDQLSATSAQKQST